MVFSRFYRFAVGDYPAPVCLDAVCLEGFYPEAVVVGCHGHGGRRGAYSHAGERCFAVEDAPDEGAPIVNAPAEDAPDENFSDAGAPHVAPVRLAAIYSQDIYDDVLFRAWASDAADYPAECLGSGLVEP